MHIIFAYVVMALIESYSFHSVVPFSKLLICRLITFIANFNKNDNYLNNEKKLFILANDTFENRK